MTDRAQPGAIDSIIRNDELAQIFSQFTDGWVVPGSDPTPAAQRRGDIDETVLDAFTLSTSGSSLDVTVAPGEAFVGGWTCRDTSTTLTLPANTTSEIVVGWDPDAVYDPDTDADRDAADETIVDLAANVDPQYPTTVVHEVTTDGSGVTGASRVATVGPAIDANAASADALEADDQTINNSLTGPEGNTTTDLTKLGGKVYYQETEPSETPSPPPTGSGGVWYPKTSVVTGLKNSPWLYSTSAEVKGGCVIDDDTDIAVIGGDSHKAHAINLSDGSKAWEFDTGDDIDSSLVIKNGTVTFGNRSGEVYNLNVSDGSKNWDRSGFGDVYAGPNIDGSTVVFGSDDNTIYGLDLADGSTLWNNTNPTDNPRSDIGISNGSAVLGGWDNTIRSVNTSNGNQQWSFSASGLVQGGCAIKDGTVVIGTSNNKLYGLDLSSGNENWSLTLSGAQDSGIEINSDDIAIAGGGDKLYAVDLNGSQQWSFATGGGIISDVSIFNGAVVFGSNDDRVYAVTTSEGSKIWDYLTGGNVKSGVAISDTGFAVIGSNDTDVYGFDQTTSEKYQNPKVSNGTDWIGQL